MKITKWSRSFALLAAAIGYLPTAVLAQKAVTAANTKVVAAAAIGKEAILIPISFTDLSIDRLEVTQSTQKADDSVALVAGRTTTVRMFVHVSSLLLGSSVKNVQGRLRVYRGTTLLYDMLSDNGPITAPKTIDRNQENHTLNFTFVPPTTIFSVGLRFEATVDPFNTISEYNESNNDYTKEASFACRSAPSIVGMPINYQYASADPAEKGTPDPNLISQGVGDAFVWGIYPFTEYTPGASGRYRVAGSSLTWTQNVDTSGTSLLNSLEAARVAMSPTPSYLYGWLRGNPFYGNGLSYINGHVAFGNTETSRHQRTFAHEFGHNLGYYHVSNKIDETGWDTLDRLGLGNVKPTSLYDIMVPGLYTNQAWIQSSRYKDVYTNDTSSCIPVILKQYKAYVFRGIIFEQKWMMQPVYELVSLMQEPIPLKEGDSFLRVLDANGKELYTTAFNTYADLDSRQGEPIRGFSVTTPAIAEASAVEVYIEGKLQGVIKRTRSRPSVRVEQPVEGSALKKEVVVAWKAEDGDRDALNAIIRFSPDGGETFIPVAVDQQSSELRFSTENLPGTSDGILQVVVSDGLNSTTTEVKGLRLERNLPPNVRILKPQQRNIYKRGANVILQASVEDAEDKEFSEKQIQWNDESGKILGYGALVNYADLPSGSHRITVSASDSSGNVAQDSVVIAVE
ncbi:MAG: hypothetical protein JW841_17905 [Deltaproteobacteria bacterium]|nr:hypothetical protein [Deltaproteobacteria bacterium]